MASSTCVVRRFRSCESKRAAASFRYRRLAAAWPVPGNSPYHAAKWAVGGFTESLAQEVAPFGVKVCALEPGGMRTNWGVRANKDTPDLLPDYEPSVGSVVKALASTGAMRPATRPRSLRSSFDWLPPIVCPHISCWAVTPFISQSRLN